MCGRTTRLAPAVVAALITGFGIGCAALRAEPAAPAAAPAAAAADDCLAAPNRTSPAGTHWYYRIDRNSGRHCWYLRTTIEGRTHQQPAAGEHAVAPHSVPAHAPRPAPRTAPDKPATRAEAAAPAAPMISAPSAFPSAGWPMPPPSAPPLQTPSAPPVQTASASATDSSALEPTPPPVDAKVDTKIDTPALDPAPAPAPMPRIAPKPPAEQPRRVASEFEHIPALLGTGLVLVLILLGSVAFRIAARVLRRPQPQVFHEAGVSRWDSYSDASLAPHSAEERLDITDVRPDSAPPLRPDDWVSDDMPERREPIVEPGVSPQAEPATNESLLDADVRELLRRLPTALAKGPGPAIRVERDRARRADKRVSAPPLVPGDLNAALASWQGRRR